jgi:hypothetical protein
MTDLYKCHRCGEYKEISYGGIICGDCWVVISREGQTKAEKMTLKQRKRWLKSLEEKGR